MVKKRQNRRQKKTKQDQYDTAAYVFTCNFSSQFCGTSPAVQTPLIYNKQAAPSECDGQYQGICPQAGTSQGPGPRPGGTVATS